jgi:hypothetical protein
MIHSIKINLPANADKESIYNSIESAFFQNNFKVERKDDQLTFERFTSKGGSKFQIISELIDGFTKGRITIDNVTPGVLTCKIDYLKQLIVSFIVGLLTAFVFSIFRGGDWIFILKVGLPIMLIFLLLGIGSGNSQVEDILRKAIKQ